MSLAEKLKGELVGCGASLYGISKETGVDRAVVKRFLDGERGITLETAEKLAEYLGLELRRKRRKGRR